MLSLGFGKTSEKTVAVADVGGASAGIAIIKTSAEGPARVLVSERSVLPMEEHASEATATNVVAQLKTAAEKALAAYAAKVGKKEPPHVSEAYAIIRGPWTHSKTLRAVSKLARETIIEDRMIDSLSKDALNSDKELDHSKILEAAVIRVELNGYPTATPEGKRASHVAISALISDCDPTIRSSVVETMQGTFACPPPKLRSGSRALVSVLREKGFLSRNSLVVNMTSHTTNILAVRDAIVDDILEIPEGSRTIVKRIAGNKMPEEVFTLIRLLLKDECEGDACAAIQTSMAKAEPDLVKLFGEGFAKMAAKRRLPNTLLLLVPDDLSEWLSQFFSRIDFAQFTVSMQPFSPRAAMRHELAEMLAFENGVLPDPGLTVASALVNIEEQS